MQNLSKVRFYIHIQAEFIVLSHHNMAEIFILSVELFVQQIYSSGGMTIQCSIGAYSARENDVQDQLITQSVLIA